MRFLKIKTGYFHGSGSGAWIEHEDNTYLNKDRILYILEKEKSAIIILKNNRIEISKKEFERIKELLK